MVIIIILILLQRSDCVVLDILNWEDMKCESWKKMKCLRTSKMRSLHKYHWLKKNNGSSVPLNKLKRHTCVNISQRSPWLRSSFDVWETVVLVLGWQTRHPWLTFCFLVWHQKCRKPIQALTSALNIIWPAWRWHMNPRTWLGPLKTALGKLFRVMQHSQGRCKRLTKFVIVFSYIHEQLDI